jgi:hypothetical protein
MLPKGDAMRKQVMQQRQTAQQASPSSRAGIAGPGGKRLPHLAAALNTKPAPLQLVQSVAALNTKPAPLQLVQSVAALNTRPASLQLFRSATALNARPMLQPNKAPVPAQRKQNGTGLPDNLKQGVEALSGMSMDGVQVHYNSAQPAQLNALAYARGNDIHVAPGQERHLPHEAWHVVQQAQGRVAPTMQMKSGVPINDDQGLEDEADVMGAKATQLYSYGHVQLQPIDSIPSANQPIQRQVPKGGENTKPVPSTGTYVARGGKDVIYDSAKYPRSKFSFGTHAREEVFERYNPQRVGHRIISIRASSGEQVNVEGIQLDHQESWDRISKTMMDHNTQVIGSGKTDINAYYTLWDAKMYYNDIANLVPALGGLNAAAGAAGVNEMPRIHYGLESTLGTIQTSWTNLQAGMTAVGQGMSKEAVDEMAVLLLGIARAMNDATERLF